MSNKQSFLQFLESVHAEDYHGTDDDMPESFDSWLADLDGEDYIRYAEAWDKSPDFPF